MLTKLKQKVQQMLVAEANVAHAIGLTPNMISGLGVILALASASVFAGWQSQPLRILLATILLLISGFCDALDGVVARLYQQTTPFGGFLDSLLDRYADAAVYAGLIIGGLCDVSWGIVAAVGAFLVSYSRARAEAAGVDMESVGLAERAERMIILIIAGTIAVCWQPVAVMNAAVILLAILSNLTVLQRSYHVHKKLRK